MFHGWEKLTASEDAAILRGIRENSVFGGPYHAEFSPTDACNYECFFCKSAFVERSRRLNWERLSAVMLEMVGMGLKSIRLAGAGESLIYPEIDQLLDLCIEHKIDITNLTTNGFKLTPERVDKFLRLDTTEISFSFNDVDPERYAATNGTTERAHDIVLENISHLVAERNRRSLTRPKIIQQFFLWKGNHDQIERAYDIGLRMGVDHIYIRDMHGIDPAKRMNASELSVARESMRRIMERDREVGKLLIYFSNETILPEAKTIAEVNEAWLESRAGGLEADLDRKEFCYIPWYSTYIRGNGEVFPCCILGGSEGYPALGNIKDTESFREIWEGENYGRIRTDLRDIALSGGKYDLTEDHCYTREQCALHELCPLVKGLSSPQFYDAAYGELQALRRNPAFKAQRLADVLLTRRPFIGASS